MHFDEIWRHHGARASMGFDRGLLCLRYVGPLTVPHWRQAMRLADDLIDAPVLAVLADVSRAVVLSDHRDSGHAPQGSVMRSNVPGAMVVPATHLEQYRDFAWRLAQVGIERAVFTDAALALAWARGLIDDPETLPEFLLAGAARERARPA